jgi:RNA-directed DNA polymerase
MQDTKVKTEALDESNCGAARSRGKEAGVKAASPRTETGCEAGGADEFARQNEVPVSATQVKPGVVPRKSRPLPGEACPIRSAARKRSRGTARGNTGGERTGVSRGRSSARSHEPGVGDHLQWGEPKAPEGLTTARRTEPSGTAETAATCQLELALAAGPGARSLAAETYRGQSESGLWSRCLSPANLNEAWRRVRTNGGAAGIDGMSVAAFPAFWHAHGAQVLVKLQAGTYRPSPVRRTMIPKKTGGERPLGIPTVLDRVIQQALAQELGGVFEETFSENSYAYRPGRGAHDALRAVRAAAADGLTEAVDCDLKSFFDHVDHDLLMARVAAQVRDKPVLRLIGRYLRAGVVLPDGRRERTLRGVPQGGPLSPLLANIMLTPLDRELEKHGRRFARYADDFLVLVPDRREAERAMGEVVAFVEGELKLTVNTAKSRVDRLARCVFLGCRIERKQIRWSEAAVEEFRAEVRRLTSRTWGVSMERRLGSLGRYVQGWFGYYRISRTWGQVVELDKWMRRRVRQCYWKQWKRSRRRRKMLLRLGADPATVHLASRSRKGCWRMSTNSLVQAALTNEWLGKQGVPDLPALWVAYHCPPPSKPEPEAPVTTAEG